MVVDAAIYILWKSIETTNAGDKNGLCYHHSETLNGIYLFYVLRILFLCTFSFTETLLLCFFFLTKCWFEPVLWERRADYFMSCD